MNLAHYDNRHYRPGAGALKCALWYIVNALLFDSWLWPEMRLKRALLRIFGARVGRGVIIKPRVNIKYPWHLQLGDHVWIGEGVFIDSLAPVLIASNVCISQEAYLLTGNHDYRDPAFGLITGEIHVEEGVWIGARAIVCPGIRLSRLTVLTAGSVLQRDSAEGGVYRGNPAAWIRHRTGVERAAPHG
jgi:putative colanic acid biosynthesis acetyltransferase WcaF